MEQGGSTTDQVAATTETIDLRDTARTPPQRPRRRRLIRIAAALLGAAVLAAGWFLTGMSSPLVISQVRIAGAGEDVEAQVRALVDPAVGGTFADVASEDLTAAITAIDGVTDVDLDWAWPTVLAVTVTEQPAFAAIPEPGRGAGATIVDREGNPIRSVDRVPGHLPTVVAEPGAARDAVFRLIEEMPAEIGESAVRYQAKSPLSIVVRLSGGVVVVWGSAEQTAEKGRVVSALVATGATRIDVSAPSHPAVSGLPEEMLDDDSGSGP